MYLFTAVVYLSIAVPLPVGQPHLRLKIETIDARSLEVDLLSIDAAGTIHYQDAGRVATIALDDILQIDPLDTSTRRTAKPHTNSQVFYLADGGWLYGRLLSQGDGNPRIIKIETGPDQIFTIPLQSLAAIRTARNNIPELEHEFQARIAARRPGRDLMIVANKAKAVVARGSLEVLGPEGWTFRFGSHVRSADLDSVYGFVLAPPAKPPATRPNRLQMVAGNRFTARILSADPQSLSVDVGEMGKMILPWSKIESIQRHSDRMVFLSDLEPTQIVQSSMLGVSWPPRADRNVTGGPIRLRKKTYRKGWGVHSQTAMRFRLDGGYDRFSAIIGIDESVAPDGSVVFRVVVDGRVAYQSPEIHGEDPPIALSVDVSHAKYMTLECNFGQGLDISDHADWANAMLFRTKDRAD